MKTFVRVLQVEGLEIQANEVVQPTTVTNASAVIGNLSTESAYNFFILSSNEMGTSPQVSVVEVHEESNREIPSAYLI